MKEIFVYAGIGGIGLVVIIFIVYLSCCKQRKEVKKVQSKGNEMIILFTWSAELDLMDIDV